MIVGPSEVMFITLDLGDRVNTLEHWQLVIRYMAFLVCHRYGYASESNSAIVLSVSR